MASPINGNGTSTTSSSSTSNLVMSEEGKSDDVVFSNKKFRSLRSHYGTFLTMFVHIAMACAVLPLHWYINAAKLPYPPFEMTAIINIIIFFFTIFMTLIIQFDFEKAYEYGYADLYRITSRMIRAPFFWFSIGNTLMLLFMSLMYYLEIDRQDSEQTGIYFIAFQMIVVAEVVMSLYHYIMLSAIILRHNLLKRKPDVLFNRIEPKNSLDNELKNAKKLVGYGIFSTQQDHLIQSQNDQIEFLKKRGIKLYQAIKGIIRDLPPHLRLKSQHHLKELLSDEVFFTEVNIPNSGRVGSNGVDVDASNGGGFIPDNDADDAPLIHA